MIGEVRKFEALIDVVFILPEEKRIGIEFVIDTGFAGGLTLPPKAIEAMNLPYLTEFNMKLASDQLFKANAFLATLEWSGKVVEVVVLAMGSRPLLGTSLLAGNRLGVEFQENGLVVVSSI